MGDTDELLQELDAFCFTYQHVDCLYTLFKNRFSGKVVAKSGQVFDRVQKAVHFKEIYREWTKCLALQKKTVEKKYKKHLLLFPKDKINASN